MQTAWTVWKNRLGLGDASFAEKTLQKKTTLQILAILLVALNASIIAAHSSYGSITWNRWVFLWFLGGLSDVVAATVAFAHSWRYRHSNRFIYYYCMFLGAISLETVCVLMANVSPPEIKDYGVWYTCWFWSGRWARNFAVWMLVLYQVGYLNGIKKR